MWFEKKSLYFLGESSLIRGLQNFVRVQMLTGNVLLLHAIEILQCCHGPLYRKTTAGSTISYTEYRCLVLLMRAPRTGNSV